jgi:hypothetical protein
MDRLILLILLILLSCAKKPAEETNEAIDVALSYLSDEKCDSAIDVLEDAGNDSNNPVYLEVLASAYACRTGYSTINFITDDIPVISASGSNIFTGFAGLSSSLEPTTDSAAYLNLYRAIDILRDSSTQTEREASYGTRKSGDIGVQLLLLSIVELGKFLNHYGNADDSGAKGLGSGTTSTCFMNYTYAPAQVIVAAFPVANNCNSNTDGHPDMTNARACEGLMLFTNVLDVLNNIDLSGSEDLSALEDVATQANLLKTTALAADASLETLLNETSKSACEAALESSTQVNNMQLIFALLFEAGLN